MNVIRFHDGEGYRIAVADEGRTLVHLVAVTDGGVRLINLPRADVRGFESVKYKGAAYPVSRACRQMLASGRRLGITEGAKRQLKEGLT